MKNLLGPLLSALLTACVQITDFDLGDDGSDALAEDGTIYVAGSVRSPEGGLYGALDLHGGHLWSQLFTGGDPPDDTAVLSDGSVIFVGAVEYSAGSSYGSYLWMRRTSP